VPVALWQAGGERRRLLPLLLCRWRRGGRRRCSVLPTDRIAPLVLDAAFRVAAACWAGTARRSRSFGWRDQRERNPLLCAMDPPLSSYCLLW